jgi:iron complex outermembrane receptor protein
MIKVVVCCALAVCSFAFDMHAATLAGKVLDPSGAVVPRASLRLTGAPSGESYSAQSDHHGGFSFTSIREGAYALSAEAPGFEPFFREGIALRDGERLTLDIQLRIPALAEQVQITAKAPGFDEILTAREVREGAARDLGDALSEVDGLWKVRKGGIANDVVLRGFQSSNLNVLVDGARVFGACPNRMDPPAFHVDFSEIQEVVITKGAFDVENQGSLGGLVQIVSKRPAEGFHVVPSFAAGSFGYVNPSLSTSYAKGRTSALLGYSFRISNPYEDGHGKPFTAYANYRESARSLNAFDVQSAWGKFGFAPTEHQRLELGYTRQAGGRVLYPYLLMDALYDNADRAHASYDFSHLSRSFQLLRFQGYFTQVQHWMTDEYRTSSAGAARPYSMGAMAKTQAAGGKVIAEISDLTMGVEMFQRNWDALHTMRTAGGYADQSSIPDVGMLVAGAYANYRKNLAGALRLQAGGRVDSARSEARSPMLTTDLYWAYKGTRQTSHRDTDPAGYAQLAYALGHRVEIFGGVGRTVRLPDPQERYMSLKRMGADWVGNPNLKPTANTEADLGVHLSAGRFQLRPTVFYSWLTNYVAVHDQPRVNSVPGVMNASARSFENVDARLYGGEVSYNLRLSRSLLFRGGTSYTVGKKSARPDAMIFNTNLAEMPPLKSRAVLRYGTRVFFAEIVGLAVNAQERVDADLKETPTPGFATMGFKFGAQTTKLNLSAGVDNLFNRFYYEHLSFQRDPFRLGTKVPEPGRNFFFTCAYTF